VFKGTMEGRLAVFVLGNARGRSLLKERSDLLRPVTLDIAPLVPGGFMRRMTGEEHRRRRSHLVAGLADTDLETLAPSLRAISTSGLLEHAASSGGLAPQAGRWSDTLSKIATALIVRLVFGAQENTAAQARLVEAFRGLGPNGVAWSVAGPQPAAFAAVKRAILDSPEEELSAGLLRHMRDRAPLDEAMLGNLIYMAEFGRYDLRGLLRWISCFALAHPDATRRVAAAPGGDGLCSQEARRFVLEVLRLEQSERLMRDVLGDFEFDGVLFPRGALVRICMWENHKDPEAFPEPFSFEPERFPLPRPARDAFSPFGLDHHRCPFADASVELAGLFLETLAERFLLSGEPGGAGVRGPYHWEPASDFAIDILPREMTAR
jgi:cytochrome P450